MGLLTFVHYSIFLIHQQEWLFRVLIRTTRLRVWIPVTSLIFLPATLPLAHSVWSTMASFFVPWKCQSSLYLMAFVLSVPAALVLSSSRCLHGQLPRFLHVFSQMCQLLKWTTVFKLPPLRLNSCSLPLLYTSTWYFYLPSVFYHLLIYHVWCLLSGFSH